MGSNLDALANLDSQVADARKELEKTRQQHAEVKANAELALKQAEAAKAETDKHHAARIAEIEAEHNKSITAIGEASSNSSAQAKALLDNATQAAAAKTSEAQQAADAIVAKAKADAEAIKTEHADLTAKTVAARSDYAEAKRLLDEINARLDQHRRL